MPALQREKLPEEHVSSVGFRLWWASPSEPMRRAHTHPDVEVNYLTTGSIRYFVAGHFWEIQAGEFALFWAGTPHQTLSKSAEIRGIWITLPLARMLRWQHAETLSQRLLSGDLVRLRAEPGDAELFRRWVEDFGEGSAALQHIVATEIEARFSRISLALSQQKPASYRRASAGPVKQVEIITRYLAQHYTEDISVEDIGRAVGLHPKYLLTLFRSNVNITLWEYVLRLRLARAQSLLLTTDRTVLDVALEAGFGSQSAFYRAFRQFGPGGSPADFRRHASLG